MPRSRQKRNSSSVSNKPEDGSSPARRRSFRSQKVLQAHLSPNVCKIDIPGHLPVRSAKLPLRAPVSDPFRPYQSAWIPLLRLASSQEAAGATASAADGRTTLQITRLNVVHGMLSSAFRGLSVVNFVGGPNRPLRRSSDILSM